MDLKRVIKIQQALKAAVDQVQQSKKLSPAQQILIKGLSGAIGAGISSTVLFPFESVKTRLMLADDEEKENGIFKMIQKVMEKEGLGGFFAGIQSYVVYSVGTYGIFFLVYEAFKKIMGAESSGQIWRASFISGIITVLLSTPLNMISNYIQSKNKKENRKLSYSQAVKEINSKYGIKGFYRGLIFSLILVINPTINMLFFERLKDVYPKYMQKDLALFLAGATSKLIATLITYPIQTLKTNMQGGSKFTSMEAIQYILRNFGPLGFFKGIQAKVVQSVLNAALMLFMYERINEKVVAAVTKI